MNGNFVNIVGYQFEKVHTGVICLLLDTTNTFVPLNDKYKVVSKLYDACGVPVPFSQKELVSISCKPEYSFGRRRKIDLVIELALVNRPTKYFVIEMKVDSIPYSKQLEGTRHDFIEKKCDKKNVQFLLFLFGSSQVCKVPPLHSFTVFRLPDILDSFSCLSIDHYIYKDWLRALKQENDCKDNISHALDQAPGIWNASYWRERN
ncbi:hypothetical protein [Aureibacillus halotolerans]|uniref:PD-(D/E)XK nuclease superfamily protein n=1 Tax=Aureibacillus halotolerans TaxID=1508390 RepID=A0A4R6UAJ2_9BACI|nr:hypothetical protein [Aureibacillus halotolerans]TDQ42902.1 hypothetical protein EV213_101332 [Aureibacillus halotolerans]